ncbi:hypothetical protein VH569_22730 [Azospirillum sp. 11R-A]|uniref:hypothetical protein n=1 Tax=Azospirillum sp. 11R-A TaxID=3111634 RepID=UPI003C1E83FD
MTHSKLPITSETTEQTSTTQSSETEAFSLMTQDGFVLTGGDGEPILLLVPKTSTEE